MRHSPEQVPSGEDFHVGDRAAAALEAQRAHDALRLQASTATELLQALDAPAILKLVAERIYSLAGGAFVALSEFDPRTSRIIARQVQYTEDERRRVIAILGRDPVGLSLDFPEEIRQRWKKGELLPMAGGLQEVFFRQVPAAICERLERELKLGDAFAMVCAYEEDILGSVALVARKRGPIPNQKLIEALVAQTALALKRVRAEEARRSTEEALRRSEEFLSFALTTARTAAWDLDLEDHTTRRSPQHDQIFGYPELLPRWTYETFLEHVVPEDREEVDRKFRQAVERRTDWSFECRIRRRDGETRWIWGAGRHRLDETGRSPRMAGVVQDITERKAAEEALREVDRRRTEFLAVLSHELRNPLAPIRNSLYILDHAAPGGDQAHRAKTVIDRQVGQLARLVDDLLDVTRVTRGKVQLQRERLELNELVRRTMEDHRFLFERSGVRFEVEPAREPVFVSADWNRLAQVIGNLLQNSAKFTPRGGRVTASLSTDPAARQAVIRVADTGVGMPPEVLGHLFQPFMQAEQTLDRSKGGLGLGLALVKGLVELHGGTVSGSSAGAGKGSAFTVRLPLEESVATAAPARLPDEGVAARRVLVIEDNIDAAESLRELLELDGHEVAVAYDGAEGLAQARAFRPDVVLCDIGLPGMDGYEVAHAFRGDPSLRGTFLVALSGYALPEDLQRAHQAGFDRHLSKPTTQDKLAQLLGSVAPAVP